MEEIESPPDTYMGETEEVFADDVTSNYLLALRTAHRTLLPTRKFAHDVVNECHMIKVGIKDLVQSSKSDAEKYAILLQLAADSKLQIDASFSLYEIGAAVQDYYMNTCLAISDEVAGKLAPLWGLGVRPKVKNYGDICRSIARKMKEAYSFNWSTPRYIITMLYDPEIGLIGKLTRQRLPRDRGFDPADFDGDLPEEEERRRKVIYKKGQASDIVIWKINSPDDYREVYETYNRHLSIPLQTYVSDRPEVSRDEADFFRNYHKYNEKGGPIRFSTDEIMETNNSHMWWTAYRRMKMGEANIVAPRFNREEMEFVLMVRDKFLNGDYPIDMKWSDLCNY